MITPWQLQLSKPIVLFVAPTLTSMRLFHKYRVALLLLLLPYVMNLNFHLFLHVMTTNYGTIMDYDTSRIFFVKMIHTSNTFLEKTGMQTIQKLIIIHISRTLIPIIIIFENT